MAVWRDGGVDERGAALIRNPLQRTPEDGDGPEDEANGAARRRVAAYRAGVVRERRGAVCFCRPSPPNDPLTFERKEKPAAWRLGRARTAGQQTPTDTAGRFRTLIYRSAPPVCSDAAGMLPKTALKTASRDIPAPRAAASFCNLLLLQPPRGSARGNLPVLGVRHARYAMFIVSLPIRSPISPCTSGGSRCAAWRSEERAFAPSDESPGRHPGPTGRFVR